MELGERISRWMRGRVRAAGASGVVVGLSGGVDSAVVSVLAKKALGDRVLTVIMPCHSLAEDERDAILVADFFHFRRERVDLSPVYDAFVGELPEAGEMCRNNLKPRLRMAALYYYANIFNYLVAGTGNKSERLVGYFTKYGDGGADLLPLGDLTKTQVWKLARELEIPRRIIDRPPSAGLREGQTDEEDLDIRYRDLDRILVCLENGNDPRVSRSKLRSVKERMARSKHKLAAPPVFRAKLP